MIFTDSLLVYDKNYNAELILILFEKYKYYVVIL